MRRPSTASPGDGLLHPVPLTAILLLLLNDHLWKYSYPGFLTGKLSDVAGLIFFPLLLQALWEVLCAACGRYRGPSARALVVSVVLTGVVFAAVKISPEAGWLYRVGLAALQWPARAALALAQGLEVPAVGRVALTQDPSDLWALPALLVALWVGLRRVRRGSVRERQKAP